MNNEDTQICAALREALRESRRIPSSDDTCRRQAHELTNAALERPISRYLKGHQHWMRLFLNKGRASKDGLVEMHQDWNITDESCHRSMSV